MFVVSKLSTVFHCYRIVTEMIFFFFCIEQGLLCSLVKHGSRLYMGIMNLRMMDWIRMKNSLLMKLERKESKERILGKRKSKQGLEIYVSRCSKLLYKKKTASTSHQMSIHQKKALL